MARWKRKRDRYGFAGMCESRAGNGGVGVDGTGGEETGFTDPSKTVPVPLSCCPAFLLQVKPYLSRFLACPAFLLHFLACPAFLLKQVAEFLGVCVRTVRRMVDAGEFPAPVKMRGRRVFVPAEVQQAVQRLPRGIGR